MHPVVHLGGFTFYSYGVLLAAAVLVGVGMGIMRGIRFGIPAERMRDVAMYGVLAGVLGGRLLGFILAYDPQRELLPQLVRMSRATGAVQGGLIAAMIVSILYLRRHRIPIWRATDAAAPGMAIAQGIGRTGCFLAGCCFGVPSDAPWAVTFVNPISTALAGTPLGVPLHPTQLYEAAASLLIGTGLLVTETKWRYFPGRTFWLYALLYSFVRFVIEFFRPSGAAGISTAQMIAIGVGILSLVMLYRLARASRALVAAGSGRRAVPAVSTR